MKEYTVHGHKASMFQERFEECNKSEVFSDTTAHLQESSLVHILTNQDCFGN